MTKAKYEIDVHVDGVCSRCGKKAITYAAKDSDAWVCQPCLLKGIRRKP